MAAMAATAATDARKGRRRPVYRLIRPVFFVGFMGAGKTSVARRLARRYGIASIDLDTYLERCEGMRIKEIFSERGEEAFREIEAATLRTVACGDPLLVSCGGGIVGRPENRALLKDAGFVVYLKVAPGEAATRISDLSTRPLLADIEGARRLCEERLPLYEGVADVTIDTAGRYIGGIAREAGEVLEREGVLWRVQR